MFSFSIGILLAALLLQVRAAAGAPHPEPSVFLDGSKFIGIESSAVTQSFLGIPFALPPTGDRRLRLPAPIPAYNGTYTVNAPGPACPQKAKALPNLAGLPPETIKAILNFLLGLASLKEPAEDCLTLNVIKPTTATNGTSKLPVVVWIFGGGFEIGHNAMIDGVPVVQRSIAMKEPVIYVSLNYRLAAFRFLASKEIRADSVGNLGLQDQRQALRWIQKYITEFGGDPAKVAIWGESSGAISVSLQMLTNSDHHEGLFRAGFMQSGAPVPVGPVEKGQKTYDAIVQHTGCSGSFDTLACLRSVSYEKFKAAQDALPSIFSYKSLTGAWFPREDGVFLTDTPQHLVQQGKVANVSFISGNCDDEGTIFSRSTLNITRAVQFLGWVSEFWLPQASAAQIESVGAAYPSNIVGSPFDTRGLDASAPQFKRHRRLPGNLLSRVQGDGVFQAPRRFFQHSLSGRQEQWGFCTKRYKLPIIGSFHGSDLLNIYFGGELTDYLINFATTLNPNGPTVPHWPAYTVATPNMMTLQDGPVRTTITQDTCRAEEMHLLMNLTLQFPI
ncbi:carotenoid ester lipase precursor [Mycena latifolia]|nr:carotenoid ester lipase precursor [Mycena latifolia]